jgi:hypothetical protein
MDIINDSIDFENEIISDSDDVPDLIDSDSDDVPDLIDSDSDVPDVIDFDTINDSINYSVPDLNNRPIHRVNLVDIIYNNINNIHDNEDAINIMVDFIYDYYESHDNTNHDRHVIWW